MAAEALLALGRANLAAALAILAVIAVRRPARRLFGAQAAYVLWLAPPLAWAGSLLPARPAEGAAPRALGLDPALAERLVLAWLLGALAVLAWIVAGQLRLLWLARRGRAGPALLGVFAPRLVVPSDFRERHSAPERELIRLHERTHLRRGDPRANAALALFQALNWFNPLVHLAAVRLRLDQELACDAQVLAARPQERRTYAAALLKAGLARARPPLGCPWPAAAAHPLETRIRQIAAPAPAGARRRMGEGVLLGAAASAALLAWGVQPPQPVRPPWAYPQSPTVLLVEITPPAPNVPPPPR